MPSRAPWPPPFQPCGPYVVLIERVCFRGSAACIVGHYAFAATQADLNLLAEQTQTTSVFKRRPRAAAPLAGSASRIGLTRSGTPGSLARLRVRHESSCRSSHGLLARLEDDRDPSSGLMMVALTTHEPVEQTRTTASGEIAERQSSRPCRIASLRSLQTTSCCYACDRITVASWT